MAIWARMTLCALKIHTAESKDQFMSQKVALICGVSGQDGSYLAALLLSKGYKVFGTSRDVQGSSFFNLKNIVIISSSRINGPDSLIEPTASIMPERHDTMSCEMML